jgi:hypothetical protein
VTIQFLREHTTRDGKRHRVNEVLSISDAIGTELIREGIAKERKPPGPTETKTTEAEEPATPESPPEEGKEKKE